MKIEKSTTPKKQATPQTEKIIEKGLRTSGCMFPETVEEVMEFEKNFGTTDVTLPEDLQDPAFLYTIDIKTGKEAGVKKKVLALAARNEGAPITPKTRKTMDNDRAKAVAQLKKKKKA